MQNRKIAPPTMLLWDASRICSVSHFCIRGYGMNEDDGPPIGTTPPDFLLHWTPLLPRRSESPDKAGREEGIWRAQEFCLGRAKASHQRRIPSSALAAVCKTGDHAQLPLTLLSFRFRPRPCDRSLPRRGRPGASSALGPPVWSLPAAPRD